MIRNKWFAVGGKKFEYCKEEKRISTDITVNTIIAAASNIVLNFIPRYGYIAAAYTTLASYLISFMLHTRYAKKLEPNLYPLKRFLYPLIELLAVTILNMQKVAEK